VPAEGAGIQFGQYVLLRRLARGGMAEVFLAQQHGFEGFDRRVAVKRILPHLADVPDFVKMFLGEAKLAAQLTHPNIVHIYDFGKVGADYFIAMEFVDGVHAGELFKRPSNDRMSPTMVARLGADAAMALHSAHELRAPSGKPYGLVHRDVSPANLMVSFDGAVKLCDFGIAKAAAIGDQLTQPGHVKGKYAYMSPEQTTGGPLDGRSDVYSLAIVLWELIAGKTIVPRGDAIEAMRAIRDGKLTAIDRVAPSTPPQLANAITWALQTRREQRPTAMQLAQELEAFIKSSPELATPMQLGTWLRVRFTREPTGEAGAYPSGGTQAAPGTLAAPGTQASHGRQISDPLDAALVSSPSIVTSDTTSETAAVAVPHRASDAATVIGGDGPAFEPTDPPTAMRFDPAAIEPTDPPAAIRFDPAEAEPTQPSGAERFRPADAEPPGSTMPGSTMPGSTMPGSTMSDHAETVLRSGAFRAQVPGGPVAAPTLLGVRPRPATRPPTALTLLDPHGKPAPGPSAPSAGPTLLDPRAQTPIAVPAHVPGAPGGLPVRGPSAPPSAPTLYDSRPAAIMRGSPLTGVPAMIGLPPPRSRAPTETVPRPVPRRALAIGGLVALAVLSFVVALAARGTPRRPATPALPLTPAAPVDAQAQLDAPPAPPVDAQVPADAAIDARQPTILPDASAAPTTILEVRTRPGHATITIGGDSRTAPAQFTLPVGHYVIDAELDGWMPERRELDLSESTRVVQDIVFTTERTHPRPATGKLTARTTPPCDVFLGTRRLGETPITDLELAPGSYTLQFKHPQHPSATRNVTITSGKTTRLQFTLP
jgi:serine/threonine-protein kinase